MLTKKESEVMQAVYRLCGAEGRCLASPCDVRNHLPKKRKFTDEALEKTLRALEMDGYFELISSERKGEKMYVIGLNRYGFAFRRETVRHRRDLATKIIWSIASAVLAFFVGICLKKLFHG